MNLFSKHIKMLRFSPDVIRNISDKFNVSRSSVIHRFTESGNHPICVFYTENNKVHYWRRSEGFNYKIKDITKLAPPTDSVAAEYFSHNIIYSIDDSKQEIIKSTWLDVRED